MTTVLFCRVKVIQSLSITRHMAGHSKWHNIKHIKGSKDQERSLSHQRLFRQMKAAIREKGSTDLAMNLQLAHLVEQARRENVPAEKIQQALKMTENNKEDPKAYFLEVKGPGGSCFLLNILTTNITRTKQDLTAILKRFSGQWADGISSRSFDHKGIIKMTHSENKLEEALNDAIEVGAEDVTVDEGGNFVFVSSPNDFYLVLTALQLKGYATMEAELLYVPHQRVKLLEAEYVVASRLYEKLSNDPDVVKIHDNVM